MPRAWAKSAVTATTHGRAVSTKESEEVFVVGYSSYSHLGREGGGERERERDICRAPAGALQISILGVFVT